MKPQMEIDVRPMQCEDIDAVAALHSESFQRQLASRQWITCNFQAYPRTLIFVALNNNAIVGYIQWIQKSGFRKEAVIELEQIAVHASLRGQQIGTQLIQKSLPLVETCLHSQGSKMKSVLVTTRTDNIPAQQLYKNALGATAQATMKDLYSHDEVIMIVNFSAG